jgi:hypothetical protein
MVGDVLDLKVAGLGAALGLGGAVLCIETVVVVPVMQQKDKGHHEEDNR